MGMSPLPMSSGLCERGGNVHGKSLLGGMGVNTSPPGCDTAMALSHTQQNSGS